MFLYLQANKFVTKIVSDGDKKRQEGENMAVTGYLSFDHSETVGDNTFYYFRSVFVPDGALESLVVNLLAIMSESDLLLDLLDLPINFPEIIESGTALYELDGTTFTAPDDLYLIASIDFPTTGTPTPDLEDLFMSPAPLAVYVDVAPSTSLQGNVPADIDPDTFTPNDASYPNWHFPDFENFSFYPWWVAWYSGNNKANLLLFDIAYDDCEVTTGHIRNNLDMYTYESGPTDYGAFQFEASSAAGYDRSSCIEDSTSGPYTINTSSGVLRLECYMPATNDPAIWWVDDFLGIEPGEQYAINTPEIMAGVSMLADMLGLNRSPFSVFNPLDMFNTNQFFPKGAREIWPFSADSEPFAADEEPFAA